MRVDIELILNGRTMRVNVEPQRTLLDLLREDLGLTGTKKGCDNGDCGACVVLLDGEPVNSCLMLAVEADGRSITTIEGLAAYGELEPLQQAFVEAGAVQCGYCTPGMILAARALLASNPDPAPEDVRESLVGHLCRCTGYAKIIDAVLLAARLRRAKEVMDGE